MSASGDTIKPVQIIVSMTNFFNMGDSVVLGGNNYYIAEMSYRNDNRILLELKPCRVHNFDRNPDLFFEDPL